jgi:predicted transcriptional regulator
MNAVLSAVVPDWISKNRIMDNVDISHYELDLFLDVAVQKKFMEFSSDTRLYRTTESGLNFIKTYKRLSR